MATPQDSTANNPQTMTNTSSAARMLGTAATSSGGTLAQTANAAQPGGGWTMAQMPMQSKLDVSRGTPLVAQTTTTPNTGAFSFSPTTGLTQAAGVSTTGGVAPNAQGMMPNYGSVGSWTNSYSGPQVVSFRTSDGNYAYYKFNPATGQYDYAETYTQGGTRVGTFQQGGTNLGMLSGMTLDPAVLTDAERQGAQQGALGGGQQINPYTASSQATLGSVNNAFVTNEDAYKGAYTDQHDKQQAAQVQAQNTQDASYILDYMVTHGGATPPVNRPGQTGVPMSQAAFEAAAAEYKANNSASFANAAQMQTPDTSGVDQNSLAALFALNSQFQTGAGGADQAAQQANAGSALTRQAGQNLIAHNSDYAAKFNANLAAYADAVQKQGAADTNATGLKLQQDITAMSDQLQQLQQASQQLGVTQQQQVQAAIQGLQNQIAAYQAAVQQYGARSSQVMQLATGILSSGGSMAAGLIPATK